MSLLNKISAFVLAGGFATLMCSAAGAQMYTNEETGANTQTQAQAPTSLETGILFRIENIKPIKNKDGLVDKCRFLVTVYNRMDKEVKEASMVLNWKDNVADKYKIVGDKVEAVKDAKLQAYVLTKNIELKSILPHKQKSFEESIDTERCFLLFDQVDYKVTSCIADGDKVAMKDNKLQGAGTCANKFSYINSQNPEYYSEFKDVPDSVLEEQVESEKKAGIEEINSSYEGAVKALNKLSETLDKMK